MERYDCDDDLPLLVAKTKEGDAEALDRLCECCYDQVLLYFRQRIPAQAEDLTQRLFADLPRKLEGYRESGRFRAWLQGVAYHMFLTQNRSNRRRREETHAAGEHPRPLGGGKDRPEVPAGL